jgi:ribonuclease D
VETNNAPDQLTPSRAQQLKTDQDELEKIPFLVGDVSKDIVGAARKHGLVAWDIETSGLDWRSERIGVCQVLVKGYGMGIVKIKKNTTPPNLAAILGDASVQKIFHHAMFDLRFLCYHWGIAPANVTCTKIASKLLDPDRTQEHTLAALVKRHLGITLDKRVRKSDWLTWGLSNDQLKYAGDDVIYLPDLLATLLEELRTRNLLDLATRCFAHIPTQVQLDIQGYKDTYGY